ncbi:MAG TPA: VTT domain-containing protein, partial [Polyangiaceae bacterium]
MKPWLRWTALTCLVLALILVPFALWEEPITAWTTEQLAATSGRAALSGLVIALLSADVLLPIPSSFVAAGAVSLLGAVQGGASVFLGMTLAAWLGYALGLWGGQPLATRMAGERELSRAGSLMERHGSWLLLLCRGVPVLAEASTLLAGATRLPRLRFALVTALGNAGLSLAYALIGVLRLAGTPALLAPFVFGMAV